MPKPRLNENHLVSLRDHTACDSAKVRKWRLFKLEVLRGKARLIPSDFLKYGTWLVQQGLKSTVLYVNAAFLYESEVGSCLNQSTINWLGHMAEVYRRLRVVLSLNSHKKSKATPFRQPIQRIPTQWRGLYSLSISSGIRICALSSVLDFKALKSGSSLGGIEFWTTKDKSAASSKRRVVVPCCCKYQGGKSWCLTHGKLTLPKFPLTDATINAYLKAVGGTRHSARRTHVIGLDKIASSKGKKLLSLKKRMNLQLGWTESSKMALEYKVGDTPLAFAPPIRAIYEFYATGHWGLKE